MTRLRRWLDAGLFGYRAAYILPRPWVAARALAREVRWGWQRARRGYSDRDVWNLDSYLDAVLAGGLRKLATGMGYPMHYDSAEAWVADLRAAADKIERYGEVRYELLSPDDASEIVAEHKNAVYWCADNWRSLWD